MSDSTPLAPGAGGSRETPAERAEREAKHQVLIDLLAAYADHELPPETASQVDAHLAGCERCRRELTVHRAVRLRLGDEPPVAAPPALRERIAAAVAATPIPEPVPAPRPRIGDLSTRAWALLAAAALVIILGLASATALLQREEPASVRLGALQVAPRTVPLLRDVLVDYRRVTGGDLPGRARDLDVVRSAVPFPVEPLRAPGLRLLAVWTTELEGEPSAVLAYRWDDRIVLQYLVPEERFFQHSAIRSAVADMRLLAATDEAQGIIAWPTDSAGSLLVGDLPPTRLAQLQAAELLARTVGRSAQ